MKKKIKRKNKLTLLEHIAKANDYPAFELTTYPPRNLPINDNMEYPIHSSLEWGIH